MSNIIFKFKTVSKTFLNTRIDVAFNNMNLKWKMLIIMSSFLLILLIAIQLFLTSSYRDNLYDIHIKFAKQMVDGYAWNSRIPLSKRDYYSLGEYVSAIQRHPDVSFARIRNLEGENMTNRTNNVITPPNNEEYFKQNIIYEGNIIGHIEVSLNLDSIDIQIRNYSMKIMLVSTLMLALLMVLLFFVVSKLILKPISTINHAMTILSKGDINVRVPVQSNDEIGNLALSFNNMIVELNNHIAMTQCILEASPSAWMTIDANYQMLHCNQKIKQFLNLDKDAKPIDLIPESELDDIYGLVGYHLFEKVPFLSRYRQACENVLNVKKNIKLHREQFINDKYIQVHLFPISMYNGFVIRIDDVTDDEAKDSQLRQSLKVESLGVLAGGLAHDFNNVLSGVSSTVSILKFKLQNKSIIPHEKLESLVEIIDNAANKAGDIVRQMLSLSRKQEMNFVPVDLNSCITHVAKIGKNTFDKSVNINTVFYPGKAITMADPNQLESVILNLSINGWHAMTLMRGENETHGGTLTLKIELVSTDKFITQKPINDIEGNKYWLISISDTGVGISTEAQQKIFEPFFTTKSKGKGTGLGLAMVSSIIEQHNGFIDLYSELGIGTRFLIYLPETSANLTALTQSDEIPTICRGNGETILVADDEPLVREVVAKIMEEANYKPIFVENGKEAIKVYSQMYKEIDFVMLDMSMPEITGLETFMELKKINPLIKAIICSGFNLTEQEDYFKSVGIKGFTEKPYTLIKLSKVIYEFINEA
jgi:signal transduction histidine kinase/HAMP domain-containing protein